MKRLAVASLLVAGYVSAYSETYTDNARVRSAEPQYESVNVPRNECVSQWITESDDRRNFARPQGRQDRQYGGAIVGGLAGGVIGHQFGAGSGKDAATALGVVLGAITGDRLANRNQHDQYDNHQFDHQPYETTQREVKRCHTVYDTQTRVTGYRVAYDYRGQNYSTFMHTNPGSNLPVRVTVDPIEQ